MRPAWKRLGRLCTLLPLFAAGCGFFRDVKETGHEVKKVGEDVEKALNKMERSEKEKSQKQPPPAPPEQEGALLDNKVAALRLQDALRRAGAAFDRVRAEGESDALVLTGTVATAADRSRAVEIARGLQRGVKLRNLLRIEKSP